MTLLEIFLIGIGLSMDAFAVAICKGLAMPDKVHKAAGRTVCPLCDAVRALDRLRASGMDRREYDSREPR